MNRRGFLTSILALGAAPAIVRADSLMRCTGLVVPTDPDFWPPPSYLSERMDEIFREHAQLVRKMAPARWQDFPPEHRFIPTNYRCPPGKVVLMYRGVPVEYDA